MSLKAPLRQPLALLGLVLLLTGWVGCKAAPEKAETPTPAPSSQTTPARPGETPVRGREIQGPGEPGSIPPGTIPPGAIQPGAVAQKPMAVKDLPEVVAKVNGQEIHKAELMQRAQMIELTLARQGRRVTPSATFFQQVLNDLVSVVLLQQEARAQGLSATEQEVQQQIEAQKRTFPNEQAYQQALAQTGLREATLRKQIGDQIALKKFVRAKVTQGVTVSDQATREFYDKNQDKIRQPERVHLRHILLPVPRGAAPADKQKVRQQAEDLLKRLEAGEDFAKLAQESSQDQGSRQRGGDLGWVARGETVPSFETAAFALTKPNDVSPVVESPFGYHIIQLLERQQASTIPYEQVKERIGMMLKEQQARQQIEGRVRDLRSKAKVEIYI
jgi:peptidyl-prolyl cis-trans isomerase C